MNGGKREMNVSTTKTLLKWNAYRTYEEVQQFHSYCRLDPYSNGMKIEHKYVYNYDQEKFVLILILME